MQIANFLQCCAVSRTDLDGYGPGAYQGYPDGMHMEGIPLEQDMTEDFGGPMNYNSMARQYHDY